MNPARIIPTGVRQRVRNGITLAGAVLHSRRGGAAAARPDLQHFPARPQPGVGHALPSWLDAREPWVGALGELYGLPAAWPASLSAQAGLFLHALILNTAPRTVVETGTYLSISAHWMGAALKMLGGERRLHCFDAFDAGAWESCAGSGASSRRALIESSLRRAGLAGIVHLHEGDSSTMVARLAPELKATGVQLAFIDGDHSEGGVVRDMHAVEPVLDRGGYVVLHDIYPDLCGHRGPRFLIDHLASLSAGRYELCEVYTSPANYGMAVMRRTG